MTMVELAARLEEIARLAAGCGCCRERLWVECDECRELVAEVAAVAVFLAVFLGIVLVIGTGVTIAVDRVLWGRWRARPVQVVAPTMVARARPPDHVHTWRVRSEEEAGGEHVTIWRCECGEVGRWVAPHGG